MAHFKVLIAGASSRGLCLTQVLRRREGEVFERDRSPWDLPQRYRLHIDTDGLSALHQSLIPDFCAFFDATLTWSHSFTIIVDTSTPSELHASANVTFLGNTIHALTPSLVLAPMTGCRRERAGEQ